MGCLSRGRQLRRNWKDRRIWQLDSYTWRRPIATIPRKMTMGTLESHGIGEVGLVRRESYLSTKQGGTNWHIHFFGTVNPKL